MNIQQARKVLGLSKESSIDDAKQKYKELAKKYHPDTNKDKDATQKMAEINSAFDYIKKHKEGSNPPQMFTDINLYTTISFKESVLGVKKQFNFSRNVKCKSCDGKGKIKINNGCKKCDGNGTIVQKQGNNHQTFIFTMNCDACKGKFQIKECNSCFGIGSSEYECNISVNIPAGVVDGNILKINNMGHYVGNNFLGMEASTDALLFITVNSDPNLSLDDKGNIVSYLDLTLLESLKGVEKEVDTIDGKQKIKVPNLSKNKDEILLPNLGVNRIKDQKVILNVNYPKDTNLIIVLLEGLEGLK